MANLNFNPDSATVNIIMTDKALKTFSENLISEAIDRYKEENRSNPNDVLYTTATTAKLLDVSTMTLNRWRKKDYLVPLYVGGILRYRKSDIDKILTP